MRASACDDTTTHASCVAKNGSVAPEWLSSTLRAYAKFAKKGRRLAIQNDTTTQWSHDPGQNHAVSRHRLTATCCSEVSGNIWRSQAPASQKKVSLIAGLLLSDRSLGKYTSHTPDAPHGLPRCCRQRRSGCGIHVLRGVGRAIGACEPWSARLPSAVTAVAWLDATKVLVPTWMRNGMDALRGNVGAIKTRKGTAGLPAPGRFRKRWCDNRRFCRRRNRSDRDGSTTRQACSCSAPRLSMPVTHALPVRADSKRPLPHNCKPSTTLPEARVEESSKTCLKYSPDEDMLGDVGVQLGQQG